MKMRKTWWLLVSVPFISVTIFIDTRDYVLAVMSAWMLIFIVELVKSVLLTIKGGTDVGDRP